VRALIEAAGCRLLFLPPYSPDFNPIEQAWSKLKTLLRGMGARTKEALEAALSTVLDALTAADAQSWFAHCGYAPSDRIENSFRRECRPHSTMRLAR
jgi:hypothetical protein